MFGQKLSSQEKSKGNFKFPDPSTPSEEKLDKKYQLDYVKAAYAFYKAYGDQSIFLNGAQGYREMAAFAMGEDPVTNYQKLLDCYDEESGKVYINIDWEQPKLMYKFVLILMDKLANREFDPVLTPIDAFSISEKLDKKQRMKAYMELREQGVIQGVNISPEMLGFDPKEVPDDPEELEVMFEMKEKDKIAMEYELQIDDTLNKNGWKTIDKQLNFDTCTAGLRINEVKNNKHGKTSIKYISPETAIIPPSKYLDFRDNVYRGYIERITFEQFKSETDFDEDTYRKIYKEHAKQLSKFPEQFGDNFHSQKQERLIEVVRFYFKDVFEKVFETKMGSDGNERVYSKPSYKKKTKYWKENYEGEREILRDRKNVMFKLSWIVDSDIIWDNGLLEYQVDKNEDFNDIEHPIVVTAANMVTGKVISPVEMMRTAAKQAYLAWYKYQQTMAASVPDGWDYDLDSLMEVSLGKGESTLQPKDIIDMHRRTGNTVSRSSALAGGGAQGQRTVTPLPNENVAKAAQHLEIFFNQIEVLKAIVGIADGADAMSPDTNSLVRNNQIALQATENALGHIYKCRDAHFEKLAYMIVRLRQLAAIAGDSPDIAALGMDSEKFWQDNKETQIRKFGIELEYRPTDQDRQELLAMLLELVKAGQLDLEDYLEVKSVKNYKQAIKVYKILKKKKAKEMAAMQEQNMMMNAQVQQQSADQKHQQEVGKLQMKGQQEIQKEQVKGEIKATLDQINNLTKQEIAGKEINQKELSNLRDNLIKLMSKEYDLAENAMNNLRSLKPVNTEQK